MNADHDKPGGAQGRRRNAGWSKERTQRFLLIWVGGLTAAVILVAVVANFGLGKKVLKAEMAEHWHPPESKPVDQSVGGAGPVADSQLASLERTYNQVARTMEKATVSITASSLRGVAPYRTIGSGVIVAPQQVLTNLHVVKDAESLNVTVYHPAKGTYPATLAGSDPTNDLAILKIQGGRSFPYARLGNSDVVDAGDIVFSVGNPLGFGNTITSGIISDTEQAFSAGGKVFHGMFQTNTDIHEGSSGGALVNISGEVIGINTAVYAPNGRFTGIGFATPIARALPLLQHSGLNSAQLAAGGCFVNPGGTPGFTLGAGVAQSPAQSMQLAAGGCFVNPGGTPGCTLAAGTTPQRTPFSAQRTAVELGTALRCPNCNTSSYVRCPACRQRMVVGGAGASLTCPMGHAFGMSYPMCPSCGGLMAFGTDNSYALNPYSLAA